MVRRIFSHYCQMPRANTHDQCMASMSKTAVPASMHVLSNLQCVFQMSHDRAEQCRAVPVAHYRMSCRAAPSAQSSRSASQTCSFCSRPFVWKSQRQARQGISIAEGVSFLSFYVNKLYDADVEGTTVASHRLLLKEVVTTSKDQREASFVILKFC